MQEIAKYILSQLPKLNDSELNSVRELANTIHTARQVRNRKVADIPELKKLELEGDWVVRDEEPL